MERRTVAAMSSVASVTSDAPELSEHLSLLGTVDTATARLLGAVEKLTDEDLPGPSLCDGWTRAHVLTHLARNADSLVNLLLWARTGIETPQYASQFLRDSDIEMGARRPLAEQIDDLRAASDRWLALARAMPADRWSTRVRTRGGRELPATAIPGCGCARPRSTTSISTSATGPPTGPGSSSHGCCPRWSTVWLVPPRPAGRRERSP